MVALPGCTAKPRARPPMRRGLKLLLISRIFSPRHAARAAPYEKGTETGGNTDAMYSTSGPRARPPMRRGLKLTSAKNALSSGWEPRARPPMRRGLKHVLPTGQPVKRVRRARGPL